MAADVAEWLRRLTRNQIPSGSVGSNPAVGDVFLFVAFRTENESAKTIRPTWGSNPRP